MIPAMETSQVASLDAIDEHLAGIPSKWVICRSRGHSMADHDANLSSDEQSYINVLKCSRCGTKRTEYLDLEGHILTAEYDYPDGYQLPKGTGRVDTDGRGLCRVRVIHNKIRAKQVRQEAQRTKKLKIA